MMCVCVCLYIYEAVCGMRQFAKKGFRFVTGPAAIPLYPAQRWRGKRFARALAAIADGPKYPGTFFSLPFSRVSAAARASYFGNLPVADCLSVSDFRLREQALN